MKKQRDWLGIEPIVNRPISEGLSVEVYQVYVHSIKPGDVVRVRIIQQRCKWRQGIRLSTDGGLSDDEECSNSNAVILWADERKTHKIRVTDTEGILWVYNVWDTGLGAGPFESLSDTSCMRVTNPDSDATVRYECSAFGIPPDFGSLIFELKVT